MCGICGLSHSTNQIPERALLEKMNAGMGLIFGSALLMLYLFIRRFIDGVAVLGSPLFQLGVMFAIMGFQSILMGLIAELLARTYHESQSKPTYTVRETINLKK